MIAGLILRFCFKEEHKKQARDFLGVQTKFEQDHDTPTFTDISHKQENNKSLIGLVPIGP